MSTGSRPRRPRRSVLVFPATELRMAVKAASSNADCVVFDLEDSVPPERKPEARSVIETALADIDFGDKEVGVRINAVDTPYFAEDIAVVDGLPVHTVVVPKVETSADVEAVDAALVQPERPALHLAVETPLGLFGSREFCQASPLVEAVVFGAGDFVASSGFAGDEDVLIYPRSHLSLVASSLGIDALDMVFASLADGDGLARSAAMGRSLGYSGKWVIHPGQVDVVNRAFGPSAAEVSRAQRILEALSEAARHGKGAVSLDGSLVDEASTRWAEAVVGQTAVKVSDD